LGYDITPTVRQTLNADASAAAGDEVTLKVNGTSMTGRMLTSQNISNGYVNIVAPVLGLDGTYSLTANITDQAGNASVASTAISYILDTRSPSFTASASSPADNALGVDVASNISLKFNESLSLANSDLSKVVLKDVATDTPVAATISISNDTVIIDPTSSLADGTAYYVTWAAEALQDAAGNAVVAAADERTFNFGTAGGADSDADGIPDGVDNAPNNGSPDQTDRDGDGIGNVADYDDDGDGINDAADNATADYNPDQANADSDGYGDVAESDSDNDGNADIPTATFSAPADNATDVNGASNLALTFSRTVTAVTGKNVVIYDSQDNPVATIDAADAQIVISGTGTACTVTINPNANLLPGNYYVLIDAGAFKNAWSTPYAGISDHTSWNFSVGNPPPNAPNSLVLTGSTIITGSAEAGSTVELFDGANSLGTTTADSNGAFTKTVSLTGGAHTLTAKASDGTGKVSLASNALTVEVDLTAPTITAFSSTTANGSYNAGDVIALTATASESMAAGSSITVTLDTSGTVTLTAATNGTTLTGNYTVGAGDASADLAVSSFTIGTNTTDLSGNVMTSTTLPVGQNLSDNKAIIIDTTAPTLSSSSPADGAATAVVGNNLTLTFSEAVALGTGNIVLKATSGDTVIETFNVATGVGSAGGTVTVSGSTVTINPFADLTVSTDYNLRIDATAVTDTAGNAYAGIGNATTLNFGTAAASPAVTITSATYNFGTSPGHGQVYLNGSGFNNLLGSGETSSTDIKSRLDWSKLIWKIDGNGAAVTFDVNDIDSAVVASNNQCLIVLTTTKTTALAGTSDYRGNTLDTIEVGAGFSVDWAGFSATSDALTNGTITYVDYLNDFNASGNTNVSEFPDSVWLSVGDPSVGFDPANDTLLGGTGTDSLNLLADGTGNTVMDLSASSLARFSGFETIIYTPTTENFSLTFGAYEFSADSTTILIVPTNYNEGAGHVITINASVLVADGVNANGANGADVLNGSDQADTLTGNGSTDIIQGNGGIDTILLGAAGNPYSSDDTAIDTVVYTKSTDGGANGDVIWSFTVGATQGDILQFIDANDTTGGALNLTGSTKGFNSGSLSALTASATDNIWVITDTQATWTTAAAIDAAINGKAHASMTNGLVVVFKTTVNADAQVWYVGTAQGGTDGGDVKLLVNLVGVNDLSLLITDNFATL
jgi:methionine-rich copper-binding protein CopC